MTSKTRRLTKRTQHPSQVKKILCNGRVAAAVKDVDRCIAEGLLSTGQIKRLIVLDQNYIESLDAILWG